MCLAAVSVVCFYMYTRPAGGRMSVAMVMLVMMFVLFGRFRWFMAFWRSVVVMVVAVIFAAYAP
jgi:hypothetical protein